MNGILIATIGGLVTALCWGTSDWLASKSAKKLSPFQINFGLQVSGGLLTALLWLVSDVYMPTGRQILIAIEYALLITTAYLLFVKALSAGAVGIIVPIANSYALVTVLLSVIFIGQEFSGGQFAALLAVIGGSAVLAYEKNHKKIPLTELHKDTILAVCAALVWGVAFYVANPLIKELNWQTVTVLSEACMLPISFIVTTIVYKRKTLTAIKAPLASKQVWIMGVIGTTGGAALYLGSAHAGSVVIPTVLSGGGPLVASAISAIVDHEKLTYVKRAGAFVVVAGIAVLNLA